MIAHHDDGPDPDLELDDPLAVILRPSTGYLSAPPGRYEMVRRGAARRKAVRAAVGVGLSCAVAVLVALPLSTGASEAPVTPTVPLAPPPVSSPPAGTSAPASPRPVRPSPSDGGRSSGSNPTRGPAATPSRGGSTAVPTRPAARSGPAAGE